MSSIDSDLLEAYSETDYHVHAVPPFVLTVGKFSAELRDLHERHLVACSSFLTAWNPFSRHLSEAENSARQELLRRDLIECGLPYIHGIGQHPSNKWKGEDSFLILGLDESGASAFGKKYEQNAILVSTADAVPRLVTLR